MRVTPVLHGPGFWRRSADELWRLTNIAMKLEGVKGASGPRPLFSFREPDSIGEVKVMCDVDMGGFSRASLDWIPGTGSESQTQHKGQQQQQEPQEPQARTPGRNVENTPPHARFHGSISTALPPHRPEIQRSGFAAWRTIDRPPTIFGRAVWDIDMYTYLAMRVRSDGRAYFVNVQTESVEPTDLHQHRLFARRPGEWETILIKWSDFVRTNHGFVVEPQTEILRQKVKSLGIGLTDRVPGPFELCIERMWATNDPSEADNHEHEDTAPTTSIPREGGLKKKSGESIKWSD